MIDPEKIIATFGLIGILCVVFAETGLMVGFFLPGDSLLFTAGLLVAAQQYLTYPLYVVAPLITLAAFCGNQTGYFIGRKAGPKLFDRPDSRMFKREYVDNAYGYFERYGSRTIVIAQFVPILRTFTPVVAGVAKMHYATFVTFNAIGAVLWGMGVTTLGFYLGQITFVKDHIELILLSIIAVSLLPVAFQVLKAWKQRGTGTSED